VVAGWLAKLEDRLFGAAALLPAWLPPLLASALLLPAACWYLPGGASYGDDASSHLAMSLEVARHLRAGALDLWSPVFCLGSPAGYYYGPLPHLLLGGVLALTHGLLAPTLVYKLLLLAGLASLPWSVALPARRLGLPPLGAGVAGAAVLLLTSSLSFGLGLETFLYHGLFAQLPGLLLLTPALAAVLGYLRTGRRLAAACGLHGLLLLCHPFTGQVVALAAALAAVAGLAGLGRSRRDPAAPGSLLGLRLPRRVLPTLRLLTLGLLVAAASAAYWAPLRAGWAYFGGWPAGKPAQWDGTGLLPLLQALGTGTLLDSQRLPVLSLLALCGLGVWVGRGRRHPTGAALLLLGLVSLLLAAGRLAFGDLVDRLPLHREMELSRYLVPLHLVLALAAGEGFAWAAARLGRLPARIGPLARRGLAPRLGWGLGVGLFLVLFVVLLAERGGSLPSLFRTSERYFGEAQARPLEDLMTSLGEGPPGRILAHGRLGLGTHFWMGLPAALSGRPLLFSYGAGYQDAIGAAVVEELLPLLATVRGPSAARALGVRFVLSREGKTPVFFGPPTWSREDIHVHDLGPAPPVFVARAAGHLCLPPTGWRAAAGAWLASELPERGVTIRWDATCSPESWATAKSAVETWLQRRPDPGTPVGRVVRWEEQPDRYRATVVGAASGDLLVLGQGAHPGWQVALDGRPAPRLEVAPAYNAVLLPPGDHEVEFVFRRPPWSWPLWGVLPVLVGLLLWVERRRSRVRVPMA